MSRIPLRIASIVAAVGGAMLTAGSWADLTTPQGIGGLLIAAAGPILGIYSPQPRHARRPNDDAPSGPWFV